MINRPFHEITRTDVGKPWLRLFGRVWPVQDFIGRILPMDVGKRIYLCDDIVQVENDEQRAARLGNVRRNPDRTEIEIRMDGIFSNAGLDALEKMGWFDIPSAPGDAQEQKLFEIDSWWHKLSFEDKRHYLDRAGLLYREFRSGYRNRNLHAPTAVRNPGDEFAGYDPSDREILNDVKAAFKEFEESLLSTHPADLKEGFTVTHGYVPAWRDLLSAELDQRTSGLSSKVLEEGILNELFNETCSRLGDRGIVIWDDEGDGTVLHAGTEKAYERYSGEG